MAWGEWMVPELSLSAAATLEFNKRLLLDQVKRRPDEVAATAGAILEHNAMLQSILSKATKRIAELELELVLAPDETASSPETF